MSRTTIGVYYFNVLKSINLAVDNLIVPLKTVDYLFLHYSERAVREEMTAQISGAVKDDDDDPTVIQTISTVFETKHSSF